MPSGRSASITALATAGSAPVVPASPAPFTPSGLQGRHRVVVQLDAGQDPGTRHGVVHERAGEELAVLRIVLDMLGEHLAKALDDAAVQLAVEQHVVEDAPAVVDRDVARSRSTSPVSRSISTSRRARRRETRSASGSRPWCRARTVAARDFAERHRHVGALHPEFAVAELHVAR